MHPAISPMKIYFCSLDAHIRTQVRSRTEKKKSNRFKENQQKIQKIVLHRTPLLSCSYPRQLFRRKKFLTETKNDIFFMCRTAIFVLCECEFIFNTMKIIFIKIFLVSFVYA